MMMALLPHGLLGLTFAALVAHCSSLASMTNSIVQFLQWTFIEVLQNQNHLNKD